MKINLTSKTKKKPMKINLWGQWYFVGATWKCAYMANVYWVGKLPTIFPWCTWKCILCG